LVESPVRLIPASLRRSSIITLGSSRPGSLGSPLLFKLFSMDSPFPSLNPLQRSPAEQRDTSSQPFHSILMQYASSGSLEDYILSRTSPPTTFSSSSYSPSSEPSDLPLSAEAAKAAFRARRASSQADQRADLAGGGAGRRPFRGDGLGGERRGVHLLGKEEIREIFGGVVRGLEYLVSGLIIAFRSGGLVLIFPLDVITARPRHPSPRSQVLERPATSRGRRDASASADQYASCFLVTSCPPLPHAHIPPGPLVHR
jgi:hypothetical protein